MDIPELPISLIPRGVAPPPRMSRVLSSVSEAVPSFLVCEEETKENENSEETREKEDAGETKENEVAGETREKEDAEDTKEKEDAGETKEKDNDVLVVGDAAPSETAASPMVVDLVDEDGAIVSVPTAETLHNTMSLKQLKERCVELGLNSVGKKMELAERIVERMR